MSSLFFLCRGLLLILFHSPSTSYSASYLHLIWINNSICLLCADYRWNYISKPFLLPFVQTKILACLSDMSLWICHQQSKLDRPRGQFLISQILCFSCSSLTTVEDWTTLPVKQQNTFHIWIQTWAVLHIPLHCYFKILCFLPTRSLNVFYIKQLLYHKLGKEQANLILSQPSTLNTKL